MHQVIGTDSSPDCRKWPLNWPQSLSATAWETLEKEGCLRQSPTDGRGFVEVWVSSGDVPAHRCRKGIVVWTHWRGKEEDLPHHPRPPEAAQLCPGRPSWPLISPAGEAGEHTPDFLAVSRRCTPLTPPGGQGHGCLMWGWEEAGRGAVEGIKGCRSHYLCCRLHGACRELLGTPCLQEADS